MASVYQTRSGFRAQVFVNGARRSKVFRTKREALAWGAALETELRKEKPPEDQHTLGEAFDRYAREVSPGHKGLRWEELRLARFAEDFDPNLGIGRLTTADIAAWRDRRLRDVSPGTVLRELKLLGSVFEVARREWQWVSTNPVRDVRKPKAPEHRSRVIAWWEIRRMVAAMGYRPGQKVRSVSEAGAVAFLLALRTGMRAGELMSLTWENVHEKHCRLPATKTTPRNVPLTRKAKRLLEAMKGWDPALVFGVAPSTLDALFRRYRARAGLEGFTFHDSRHTAATWAARKLDVLDLCKAFGWSNPKMAMIYYNPSAADIARRLER